MAKANKKVIYVDNYNELGPEDRCSEIRQLIESNDEFKNIIKVTDDPTNETWENYYLVIFHSSFDSQGSYKSRIEKVTDLAYFSGGYPDAPKINRNEHNRNILQCSYLDVKEGLISLLTKLLSKGEIDLTLLYSRRQQAKIIHSLRHQILNPLLPLHLSLQKYAKAKGKNDSECREWESIVIEDAVHARSLLRNNTEIVELLIKKINDMKWLERQISSESETIIISETIASIYGAIQSMANEPIKNCDSLIRNIQKLGDSLSEGVAFVDKKAC